MRPLSRRGLRPGAAGVKPDLNPDEFFAAAMKTGSYATFTHEAKDHRLGPIINPAGIIRELQAK